MSDTITAPGKGSGRDKKGAGQSESTDRKDGIGAYSGVSTETEPLARLSDIEEFRAGYAKLQSGEWDVGKWQGYRLRFGVYGQLQPNVHMIRIKIPGGVMSFDWARRVAEANRRWGGQNIHVSTRQDLQAYYVKPDDVPGFLEYLAKAGITTREACGNTLRNMTACALSGVCPREHVDAGAVAQRLALSWIRHPLAQHMPRKFKATVSGCESDCGSSHIHDLGLVATHQDGKPGFKVYAGGGTGGIPISASLVADFVEEEDLPAVVEALIRVHQRYSNRLNRNKARIKFVNQRFGPEKFRQLFEDAFAQARTMPQRPWQGLDWREGDASAPEPTSPGGVVDAHDGGQAVVVHHELGLFTSDELDALTDLAEKSGAREFRTTRDQNLVIVGLDRARTGDVVDAVRAMGFSVEDAPGSVPNVVACPGTSTCAIGITNSQSFGGTIQGPVRNYTAKPNLNVKISGCQNGCGLHHVADFGFRGMGKKIAGRNAPHYQIYIGGDERKNGHLGLTGPVVPARLAQEALEILLAGYADGHDDGETVRDWALRLGKEGITALIKPVSVKVRGDDEGLFFDYGEDWEFTPPAGRVAECAAAVEDDDLQKDLADDALINTDRALMAGDREGTERFATAGFQFAAQRLRIRAGLPGKETDNDEVRVSALRTAYGDDGEVISALDRILDARNALKAADSGKGDVEAESAREALAYWIDLADEVIGRPVSFGGFDIGSLGDSGGGVADMIKTAPGGGA
jgi:sulfite reductase (NADPH) hemoprotein beta-component